MTNPSALVMKLVDIKDLKYLEPTSDFYNCDPHRPRRLIKSGIIIFVILYLKNGNNEKK